MLLALGQSNVLESDQLEILLSVCFFDVKQFSNKGLLDNIGHIREMKAYMDLRIHAFTSEP